MHSPTPATGQASFVRVGFADADSLRAWAGAPLAGPAILHYGLAARQAIAIKSQLKEAEG